MNKILFSLILVLGAYSASAQLVDGSIAPDFTITDIDGNTHNLYDILDEGKPVLLDLFATWRGPCWNFAETGVFDEFDAIYGADGTNSVFTVAVEADPTTSEGELMTSSFGDWTQLINYTLANDDNIADAYNLAFYPTIYLICPNRTVTEIGQGPDVNSYWSVESLAEEVLENSCPAPIEGSNASMQSYNSELISCGSNKITPIVTITNMGTLEMTSCSINTIIDGAIASSTSWNGSLATYETSTVTLAEVPSMNGVVTFEVDMANDLNPNDNAIEVTLSSAVETNPVLNIEVNTDYYAGETSWEIRDADGALVMSASFEFGEEDEWGGGGPDANLTHTFSESLDLGCYTFIALDAYGDSQLGNSTGTGSIIVSDEEGLEILNISANWGDEVVVAFEVVEPIGIEEVLSNKLSVFPNPASNNASIELDLVEANEVVVEVMNTLGQKVFTYASSMSAGVNKIELPADRLTAGLYYVNIKVANELITEKLNIVK
tara:strand:- start:870 stop:2345 length:1476 start_codon:yes stop_codon:yes gene_type:complete